MIERPGTKRKTVPGSGGRAISRLAGLPDGTRSGPIPTGTVTDRSLGRQSGEGAIPASPP